MHNNSPKRQKDGLLLPAENTYTSEGLSLQRTPPKPSVQYLKLVGGRFCEMPSKSEIKLYLLCEKMIQRELYKMWHSLH
jgi:hypothetical protein